MRRILLCALIIGASLFQQATTPQSASAATPNCLGTSIRPGLITSTNKIQGITKVECQGNVSKIEVYGYISYGSKLVHKTKICYNTNFCYVEVQVPRIVGTTYGTGGMGTVTGYDGLIWTSSWSGPSGSF